MKRTPIYESDFLMMYLYTSPKRIVRNNWLYCDEMSDEEYKAEMLKMVAMLERHHSEGMLVDTQKMGFIITPELQEWGFPLGERVEATGVKKVATLITADLFAQLAIEQYFEDTNSQDIIFRYFDTEEQAWKWLLED